MDQCPFCKGVVQQRRVEHAHRWNGNLYLFKNVPAEVCTQCGETFFAPETLRTIDRIIALGEEPEEVRSVPVFSL